jgi:polysaccharide deacetylase 2 family uncharacterized protein YibQ
MWRKGLLMLCLLLAGGATAGQARLAIIIDDLGNDFRHAEAVLALPRAVTVSILPRLAWSRRIAEMAWRQGRESMLHQPMASLSHRALGPGALTLDDTRIDLETVLDANLASVPHVSGVNNHMGSLLTSEDRSMRSFMRALSERGGLYFVDSRTNPRSQAEKAAHLQGLRSARRDVFLDNERDPARIRRQLLRAVKLARLKGSAIAIGHPYPETVAVLAAELPRLRSQGVALLPVSQVIDYQRSSNTWHASSSPLPKVAKNSKP